MRITSRMALIYAARDVLGCWDAFNELDPETLDEAKQDAFRKEFEALIEALREALDGLR